MTEPKAPASPGTPTTSMTCLRRRGDERVHPFRLAASVRIIVSSIRSDTARRIRAFSASSFFSLRAWSRFSLLNSFL